MAFNQTKETCPFCNSNEISKESECENCGKKIDKVIENLDACKECLKPVDPNFDFYCGGYKLCSYCQAPLRQIYCFESENGFHLF